MENKDFKHFVENNKHFIENNNSIYNHMKDWSDLINQKKIEDEWIEFEGIPNYTFKNPVFISDKDDNGDPLNITLTINYEDYAKTK